MPMPTARRFCALLLLLIALWVTGCATSPTPSPTRLPPRSLPLPAELKESESAASQDYSQRVRAWVLKVRAELCDLMPASPHCSSSTTDGTTRH